MSEEEKKAIEYLSKYINFETYGERSLDTDINTVLNLIEKQVKVIDAMARDIYIEHEPHFATEEAVKEFYFKEVENNE